VSLPDSRSQNIGSGRIIRIRARVRYAQNVAPGDDECQVLVVQDAGAVSALVFRNALIELRPRGPCNGPSLASGTEYSRWRSSTLDPGASDKRDADLVLSRAEYAQRRSFDPGISDAVRNIQEPSTLGGDLLIPVSRMRILESSTLDEDRVFSVSRSLVDCLGSGFGAGL